MLYSKQSENAVSRALVHTPVRRSRYDSLQLHSIHVGFVHDIQIAAVRISGEYLL